MYVGIIPTHMSFQHRAASVKAASNSDSSVERLLESSPETSTEFFLLRPTKWVINGICPLC